MRCSRPAPVNCTSRSAPCVRCISSVGMRKPVRARERSTTAGRSGSVVRRTVKSSGGRGSLQRARAASMCAGSVRNIFCCSGARTKARCTRSAMGASGLGRGFDHAVEHPVGDGVHQRLHDGEAAGAGEGRLDALLLQHRDDVVLRDRAVPALAVARQDLLEVRRGPSCSWERARPSAGAWTAARSDRPPATTCSRRSAPASWWGRAGCSRCPRRSRRLSEGM
jgi:hypothetical protein